MSANKIKTGFETLRWRDGRLEMIDQRVLPSVVNYLPYTSAAETAAGIRDMVVRGAPAIGCAAAYGIALEALQLRKHSAEEFNAGLEAAFATLAATRPTAVNLFWALERMREHWQSAASAAPATIAFRLLAAAQAIHKADIAANRRMGEFGAALLADGARVLTHCNAGALATAGHGTALGVIRSAVELAGDRPMVSAMTVTLVTALLFTSMYGVGAAIAIGVIVLLLVSLGRAGELPVVISRHQVSLTVGVRSL